MIPFFADCYLGAADEFKMQVELFITSRTERAECKGGERRLLLRALLKTLLLCLVVKNFGLGDFLSNNFTRRSSLKES